MVDKIQKNVDVVNNLASVISNMEIGEKIAMTPLSKGITLSNGKNPHVHTIVRKLDEADLWKEVSNSIKFIRTKEGKLKEIEKIESGNDEIMFKREIRNSIVNINNKIDSFNDEFKKLVNSLTEKKHEKKSDIKQ